MYGGSSGGRIGDTVFGGSATPSSGASIVRGGFGTSMGGSTGGAHASGAKAGS
jgi:hypothetical protein